MKIITSASNKKKLMDKFCCSQNLVSTSLNFRANSLQARKLRHFAMNYMRSWYLFNG